MKTSEVLYKAAELIRSRGWAQGMYVNGGGVCMLGACKLAAGMEARDDNCDGGAAADAIDALAPVCGMFIDHFNDCDCITSDDACAALEIAADIAAAEGN